jgi:hypothetical protein
MEVDAPGQSVLLLAVAFTDGKLKTVSVLVVEDVQPFAAVPTTV